MKLLIVWTLTFFQPAAGMHVPSEPHVTVTMTTVSTELCKEAAAKLNGKKLEAPKSTPMLVVAECI